MPCATLLRSRCSKGAGHAVEHAAVDFDRAADDVQPHLLAGFLGRLAHHAVQPVGHGSRTRPCACAAGRPAGRASAAPARPVRPRWPAASAAAPRCTVATSLTDSAIMRVSSWKRVKRSNSSGSNSCDAALAASMRDCICDSACSSMSRSWRRSRSRFSVRSPSEPLIWPTSASMRERVMLTSPAWLTRRSSSGARTRTAAVLADRLVGRRQPARRGPRLEAAPVDRRGLASAARPRGLDAAALGAAGASRLDGLRIGLRRRVGRSSLGRRQLVARRPGRSTAALQRGIGALHRTGRPSSSKLPVMASTRASSASTSALLAWPLASRCSMAVSSRCAISPRRIAPASRAPPLKVCSVRMQAAAAAGSAGRRAQSRMRDCSCGSSSSPSSRKIGNSSSSIRSTASMSSSSSGASSRDRAAARLRAAAARRTRSAPADRARR